MSFYLDADWYLSFFVPLMSSMSAHQSCMPSVDMFEEYIWRQGYADRGDSCLSISVVSSRICRRYNMIPIYNGYHIILRVSYHIFCVYRIFHKGYIWRQGYADGGLVGEVYGDVEPAFQRWTQAGKRLAIYSSGSREVCYLYCVYLPFFLWFRLFHLAFKFLLGFYTLPGICFDK